MIQFNDCPCTGKNLAKLVRPAILAILSNHPLHGYEIATEIGDRGWCGDDSPDLSGIYRILNDCEASGQVKSHWDTPKRGGARRVYALTPEGRECLTQWHETLSVYLQHLSDLNDYIATSKQKKTEQQAP